METLIKVQAEILEIKNKIFEIETKRIAWDEQNNTVPEPRNKIILIYI